jgi:polyhydroxyalkanoate synthesis repressor PhaR
MRVVKRYPNRKLYDTEAKRYITLEGISILIRQGEEIQVLDHTSGQDLTTVTLTQIILEQEKKRRGFVPQSVLTGLVQAGGDTLGALRRSLASPLELARQVDDEIERRLHTLTHRGELAAEDGRRLRDKLLAQGVQRSDAPLPTEEEIEQALEERGVPSPEEMQRVLEQLEMLASKLDTMSSRTESG